MGIWEDALEVIKDRQDVIREKLERKRELLNAIEKALGIELKDWQRQYALMMSDWRPEDVRGCGKTLESHLRVLINAREMLNTQKSGSIYKRIHGRMKNRWNT